MARSTARGAGGSDGASDATVALTVALIGAMAVIVASIIGILPNIIDGDDGTPSPSHGQSASPSSQTDGPTPTPSPTPTTTPAPAPLSFLGRVAGDWTLESWTERGGPITLGIEVLNGTLMIVGSEAPTSGQASWRMDIQERGEPTTPQPAILCGGQATLTGTIEGVPGGERNSSVNWTADLRSIDRSTTGDNLIWLAMCGWATIGSRDPFAVTLEGDPSQPAGRMEMANDAGTFRWRRP